MSRLAKKTNHLPNRPQRQKLLSGAIVAMGDEEGSEVLKEILAVVVFELGRIFTADIG